jgi:hypothetical protein
MEISKQYLGLSAAALSAALIVVFAPVVVGSLLSRPYLGLTVSSLADGGVRVAAVEPGSSAARAGLQPGDQLLALDALQPRPELGSNAAAVFELDALNRFAAGDTVSWQFMRERSPRVQAAVLQNVPAPLVLTHLIVYFVFWAVAALLLWTRPHDPVVRHLGYTILALTAGNFYRPITDIRLDSALGMAVQQLCALGRFLGPALVVHFGVIFPRRTLAERTARRVLAVAYGVPLLLFVVEEFVLLRGASRAHAPYLLYDGLLATIRYWDIRFWTFLAAFAACAVLMIRTNRRLTVAGERAQVKWVMWGVLFAVVVDATIVGVALYVGGRYSDYLLSPYRNLLYLSIAAGLLIAIMRYDLFDIDRVIRRSAVYLGTTASLFILFTSGENLLSGLLARVLPAGANNIGTLLSGLIAAVLFLPVQRLLDRVLNRMLGRPRALGAAVIAGEGEQVGT